MPNADIYRFTLGEFDCTIVNDGTHNYPLPGQLFFENAPRERLAAALAAHGIDLDTWETYVRPYPSLVVQTGDYLVLVDTGMGTGVPTTGKLMANLQAAGFQAKDFDTVILTHAHPGHIGGTLDQAGRPAFPNARYVMSRDEWAFWEAGPLAAPPGPNCRPSPAGWCLSRMARRSCPAFRRWRRRATHPAIWRSPSVPQASSCCAARTPWPILCTWNSRIGPPRSTIPPRRPWSPGAGCWDRLPLTRPWFTWLTSLFPVSAT
jgi:hypothetical protein